MRHCIDLIFVTSYKCLINSNLVSDTWHWDLRPPDGLLEPGWAIYLHGSFRDGPSVRTGRTGWAFVAKDATGEVVAAAYGVPPPWVRSIHGAEVWAFRAALSCALPAPR